MIPKVYADTQESYDFHRIAVNEKGIRGMVAAAPNTLFVQGEKLKLGYVGTVSVHPYARSEGHMRKLMELTLEGMRQDGCDLALLGGQRQRYGYFGFSPCGAIHVHRINSANVRHALKQVDAGSIRFVPLNEENPAWVEAACVLYNQKPLHACRNRENFLVICRTWYCATFAILMEDKFAGYLIASQNGGISELAVYDKALYPCIFKGWMQTNRMEEMTMEVPLYEKELNAFLFSFAEHSSLATNGEQVHVFHFVPVIDALLRLKGQCTPLANGEMRLEIEGEKLTLCVKDGQVSVSQGAKGPCLSLSRLEAQTLLFHPLGDPEGSAPKNWLPLPLFMPFADQF